MYQLKQNYYIQNRFFPQLCPEAREVPPCARGTVCKQGITVLGPHKKWPQHSRQRGGEGEKSKTADTFRVLLVTREYSLLNSATKQSLPGSNPQAPKLPKDRFCQKANWSSVWHKSSFKCFRCRCDSCAQLFSQPLLGLNHLQIRWKQQISTRNPTRSKLEAEIPPSSAHLRLPARLPHRDLRSSHRHRLNLTSKAPSPPQLGYLYMHIHTNPCLLQSSSFNTEYYRHLPTAALYLFVARDTMYRHETTIPWSILVKQEVLQERKSFTHTEPIRSKIGSLLLPVRGIQKESSKLHRSLKQLQIKTGICDFTTRGCFTRNK